MFQNVICVSWLNILINEIPIECSTRCHRSNENQSQYVCYVAACMAQKYTCIHERAEREMWWMKSRFFLHRKHFSMFNMLININNFKMGQYENTTAIEPQREFPRNRSVLRFRLFVQNPGDKLRTEMLQK